MEAWYSLCAWAAAISAPFALKGARPLAERIALTASITAYGLPPPFFCAAIPASALPTGKLAKTINAIHRAAKNRRIFFDRFSIWQRPAIFGVERWNVRSIFFFITM
jgi:hypothetical protein